MHGCRIANKIAINSDSESPATIYYKAEIYRYFRCDTFKGVSNEITNLLSGVETNTKYTTIEDYYFMHLLAANPQDYGLPETTQFLMTIKNK